MSFRMHFSLVSPAVRGTILTALLTFILLSKTADAMYPKLKIVSHFLPFNYQCLCRYH